jgi:copper ion binding protein
MKKKLSVDGMTCQHCVKRVVKIIEKHQGVSEIEVSLENKEASFTVASEDQDVEPIVAAINDFGYKTSEKI